MRARLVLLLMVLAAGACAQNAHGHLHALRTGDVSEAPAPRGRFDAPLTAACGPGTLTGDGADAIVRLPYLQQVTSRSALVMFTAGDTRPLRVDVTTPDGAPVTTAPVTIDPSGHPAVGRQWLARLDGLPAASLLCYRIVRAADGDALTARTGFRTAPAPGTHTPIHFVAVGDTGGGGDDQRAVRAALYTVPMDLVLHLGDAAWPSGTLALLEDRVFATYPELLRSVPLYPVSGNHEYRAASADPFRQVFALPENGGDAGRERWYSFDWGDVHFVALDTEQIGRAQAAWLEADLLATHAPWIVVYGHRPPFSSGEHGGDAAYQATFVPILERHHVALVLSGHEHDYERTLPIGGITYVVSGGGGVGTRAVGQSRFTAFSLPVLQFLAVDVDGDTMRLHAIDATGTEFDSAVIRKRDEQRAQREQRAYLAR